MDTLTRAPRDYVLGHQYMRDEIERLKRQRDNVSEKACEQYEELQTAKWRLKRIHETLSHEFVSPEQDRYNIGYVLELAAQK